MSRFVTPAEVHIPLSDGDYLIVKATLNAGETRALFARMRMADDPDRVDPLQVGIALAVGYLLDWSLTDAQGRLVSIREQPPEVVQAALDNLEYDDYQEVLEAVQAHDQKILDARAEKKTRRAGLTASDRISQSLAAVAGAMSG